MTFSISENKSTRFNLKRPIHIMYHSLEGNIQNLANYVGRVALLSIHWYLIQSNLNNLEPFNFCSLSLFVWNNSSNWNMLILQILLREDCNKDNNNNATCLVILNHQRVHLLVGPHTVPSTGKLHVDDYPYTE